MLRGNIHFKQLQHALDPKLQHPFEVSSKTLWLLRSNIPFLVTSQTLWMLRGNIHSINFQDALDATSYQPCEATSKTLWMLRCNIQFDTTSRVPRSYPKRLNVIFNSEGSDLSYVPKSPLNVPQSPLKVLP